MSGPVDRNKQRDGYFFSARYGNEGAPNAYGTYYADEKSPAGYIVQDRHGQGYTFPTRKEAEQRANECFGGKCEAYVYRAKPGGKRSRLERIPTLRERLETHERQGVKAEGGGEKTPLWWRKIGRSHGAE